MKTVETADLNLDPKLLEQFAARLDADAETRTATIVPTIAMAFLAYGVCDSDQPPRG